MSRQAALEQQALEQLRKGELLQARETLQSLAALRPNDAALKSRIQQVEQLISQRTQAQSRIHAEPLRYAHAYIQAGRLAEGLQLLRAALSRDPSNQRLRELALEVARRLRAQVHAQQTLRPKRDSEQVKREAQERARREAELRDRREAEERARQQMEERARRAREEAKAKREAEERARREEQQRAREEAAVQARAEAEERGRLEAEQRARRAAEEQARLEAEAARVAAELQAERAAAEAAVPQASPSAVAPAGGTVIPLAAPRGRAAQLALLQGLLHRIEARRRPPS